MKGWQARVDHRTSANNTLGGRIAANENKTQVRGKGNKLTKGGTKEAQKRFQRIRVSGCQVAPAAGKEPDGSLRLAIRSLPIPLERSPIRKGENLHCTVTKGEGKPK